MSPHPLRQSKMIIAQMQALQELYEASETEQELLSRSRTASGGGGRGATSRPAAVWKKCSCSRPVPCNQDELDSYRKEISETRPPATRTATRAATSMAMRATRRATAAARPVKSLLKSYESSTDASESCQRGYLSSSSSSSDTYKRSYGSSSSSSVTCHKVKSL